MGIAHRLGRAVLVGNATPYNDMLHLFTKIKLRHSEKFIMNQNSTEKKDSKILIVDDIPANLNVLCQALETEGYRIVAAPSGTVALQIAHRTQPDLILLDVMMPEMDGFETCRRLKADASTAEIPVIFITAKDEISSVVKGFEVGGVDYITKPFSPKVLLGIVLDELGI